LCLIVYRIGDTVIFRPWFLPQRIGFAIHSLVPPFLGDKMRYFFDDYGSMICGTGTGYHSNGMCRICYGRIRKKVMLGVRRRSTPHPNQRLDLMLFRQEKLARKLLAKYSRRPWGNPKARRTEPERSNPVYEALSARVG
jgi:hypothetical protein